MIFKFLKLIVSLLLIVFITILISETEGNTKIDWLGWGIEIETSYLVLILAFFSLILIFLDRLWLMIINIPSAAISRRDKKNRQKVEQNLVKAYLLASHGEHKQAALEARMINKSILDKKLGKIILKHADTIDDLKNENDNKNSDKYLLSLTNEKNTSFIGYLALMKKEKDLDKIYEYANEAFKIDPSSEQVSKTLFLAAIRLKNFKKALELSENTLLKNLFPDNQLNIILSELNFLEGLNILSKDNKRAEKYLTKCLEFNPGHFQACLNLIKIIKGFSVRSKSMNVLKKTFFSSPNYDVLIEMVDRSGSSNSGEKVSFAKKIIKNNSLSSDNKIFAKVLVAKFSVSQEIWGEAKSILETIKESEMPKEGFEILAEIASSQNNTNDVRTYLKQAANTKVGFGYLCKSCGYDNGINDILCPSCNDVGTISWGNNYNQRQSSTSIGIKKIV